MSFLFQLSLEGVALGSLYALVALGFVVMFKASKVLNFAQGELVLFGAYLAVFFLVQLGLPWWAGIAAVFVTCALLGAGVQFVVMDRLVGKSPLALVMITIGLANVLQAVVQLMWGAENRALPAFFPNRPLKLGGVHVQEIYVWALLCSLGLIAVSWLFFHRTRLGVGLQAVANDQVAALSMGIDVRVVLALAWMVSAVVAAAASLLLAQIVGVNSNLTFIGLKVFPVVILGGLESLPGTLVAGVLLGVVETLSKGYLGRFFYTDVEVVPFALMLAILLVRPYGLFGLTRTDRL